MKVVLDTNAFISCIGKKSAWRNVFDAFLDGQYFLCLSTEMMLEYEEKFTEFWGAEVATNLLGVLMTAPNVGLYSPFYNFLLVEGDADDNKFADTYIAAEADLLISNDRQLLKLNEHPFPKVSVMQLEAFATLLAT